MSKVFAGRKVNVVLDTVESIDFENNKVTGNCGTYEYEYLVLAAGSKPTYFGVPGAEEFSHKLWSFDDAVNLREHIHSCFRKAATETNPEKKKRLLTFHVVGAGFTGVEMVGELAEYVPILCEKYEIDRKDVSIYNVDVLTRTVPNLPEKLSNKVENRLKKMGVTMMLNNGVVGVGEDFIETKNGDKVTRHAAGTVIWAAGIESSDITNEAAKTLQSAARGRIKLDSYLRSLDNDHVYVVGDNMLYTAEGEERPVPQMVENCEQSAAVAAKNIYSAITGKGEMTVYKPSFHGMMVCIGGRYGVARVGFPNFMFNLPSFLAMFAKHFINIIYFIQVLGWNKIFSYVKHEFFTIRNCRSFVGGHFSNRTPSFLLVALRIWLGAVWLFEGVMKIVEGWFDKPHLKAFFGGANGWYDSILKGAVEGTSGATGESAKAVAEAVSSATVAGGGEAVTEGISKIGTTIINFDFLSLFRIIFVSGKELAESALSDFAFRLDIPLMNTFVNKVILANDSIQMFMQISIVIAEILIGLALIGGLFTTPASAVSLILQFMFVCTTGLYLGTFWMIFAGIAVLIGAGRTFGLDYYVMPFLKRQWKKLPIVKKWYIYND
ncbi:NAD(P)/FAD-dependent oxidoreductase [Ruminiclostridium josui]|uniref:NAD(P)/FAD-dependent oxidoreductase n=1 Tax=Ruminiclostridium josui TaxID=1499 RepID=UPI000A80AD42